MRKFFSVLLCIILIISICICSSVSGSAVFVIDDALIASIGISLAASVLLSIGIAAVSDSESQYVQFAEACGQLVWEQLVQDYTQAEILAMITIENGKAYFRCPSSLYTRIKNWALNYDFSSLVGTSHITVNSSDFITSATYDVYSQIKDYVAVTEGNSSLSVSQFGYTVSYLPGSSKLSLILGNAIFVRENVSVPSTVQSLVLYPVLRNGISPLRQGMDRNYHSCPVDDIFYVGSSYGEIGMFNYSYASFDGQPISMSYNERDMYCNGQLIFSGMYKNDYVRACMVAGTILCNRNNSVIPTNTTDGTTISVPVETETYAPAIPGNRVGSDQTVLVPIPSHFEDPSLPDIPLPQRTVKNRVKRGQDVALVPDLPSLKDKTPQDLGVLVVNNTEIQDTTISPTLDTSVYGEDSTTYVIIPQVPINTPIPNDDNQPLVSSPYPDVINPGNETISINAGDDVFPTASNPPASTVRPSVSVSNPDEVASSAAGEVVEGVSDVVKEGVSELVEPLSPSDIEKGANRMKLTPQLLSKFPFCIPFDFYNAINQFSAPAEVPQFDIPIEIESLNFHYDVHVDLTQYETAAKISRWLFSVAWVITLIFLTRKVIWK